MPTATLLAGETVARRRGRERHVARQRPVARDASAPPPERQYLRGGGTCGGGAGRGGGTRRRDGGGGGDAGGGGRRGGEWGRFVTSMAGSLPRQGGPRRCGPRCGPAGGPQKGGPPPMRRRWRRRRDARARMSFSHFSSHHTSTTSCCYHSRGLRWTDFHAGAAVVRVVVDRPHASRSVDLRSRPSSISCSLLHRLRLLRNGVERRRHRTRRVGEYCSSCTTIPLKESTWYHMCQGFKFAPFPGWMTIGKICRRMRYSARIDVQALLYSVRPGVARGWSRGETRPT